MNFVFDKPIELTEKELIVAMLKTGVQLDKTYRVLVPAPLAEGYEKRRQQMRGTNLTIIPFDESHLSKNGSLALNDLITQTDNLDLSHQILIAPKSIHIPKPQQPPGLRVEWLEDLLEGLQAALTHLNMDKIFSILRHIRMAA